MTSTSLLDAALSHHNTESAVLAVNKDKKPYHKGWDRWLTERQTEEEVNAEFANGVFGLGLLMWPGSPYAALDFDGKHAEEAWQSTSIELPTTARNFTRSGGTHLIFRMPKDVTELKRKIRLARVDCDCQKDGKPKPCGVDLLVNGYACFPPTPGYSEDPDHPLEDAVPLPWEIINLAKLQEKSKTTTGNADGKIPQGERNSTLTSLAGTMRGRGMSVEAIRSALHEENKIRCDPPLDDREIESIVKGASGWAQGEPKEKPNRTPITVKVSDVQREEVSWLWTNRIPRGKLTIIDGDPGVGKSFLSLAIATAVTCGCGLPGELEQRDPQNVLIMSAEDGLADTIRPRLEDMGADISRAIAFRGLIDEKERERPLTLSDLDVIEKAIHEHKPALIIIDPIIAFTASKDTHKANEVRGLLAPLAALAEKHCVAILAIRHLNKGTAKAAYRGQGSIDFLAACRSAFLAGEDPENPAVKVLIHAKANLGPKMPSLTYSIDEGRFLWGEESTHTAEQLLAQPPEGEEQTVMVEARGFLHDLLSNAPVASGDVFKQGKAEGISMTTLKRAKRVLGVKAQKLGFKNGWEWELPPKGTKNPEGAHHNNVDPFGPNEPLRQKRTPWGEVS